MESLRQFKNADLRYNPAYFDEETLEAFLQEEAGDLADASPARADALSQGATVQCDLNYNLAFPSDFDPAFALAWEWMNEDPEIRQGLAQSGLSKHSLSQQLSNQFARPIDAQAEAEFIDYFNANRMQVSKWDGRTLYSLGDMPVLEVGDSLGKGVPMALWTSLVFNVTGLCFALAACRVQYKIGEPAHLTGAVRRNAVANFAEVAEYGAQIDKHFKDLKKISAICSSLSAGCRVMSGTLKQSLKEAVKSLSLKDWALAIGGIFTSLAAILVSGGGAIAVKWAQVLFAAIPVVKDVHAICHA